MGVAIGSALVIAVTWVFDVFVFNQGALALVVGIGGGVVALVSLFRGVRRNEGRMTVIRSVVAVAWFALPEATIDANLWIDARAAERASLVVRAVEAYREDHGAYPATLTELVPGYLPYVPRAKPTSMGTFEYRMPRDGSAPTLWYVVLPPFGRRAYHFDERRWITID